jgi:hypothetical protein
MTALSTLAMLVLQVAPAPAAQEKPPVEPWRGTLAQGLAEVRRLAEADKNDAALEVAERLLAPGALSRWRERATAQPGWKKTLAGAAGPGLAAAGFSDLSSPERAAVHFARGIVLEQAQKSAEAADAFEKARALAGPGDLRLDATYDLGWTSLAEGEGFRAQIPEVSGAKGSPAAPPAPSAPPTIAAGQAPAQSDTLPLAREAYLKARERFVERLKADWKDADTRATVELVQKRLRELSEIEKKREEEQKKQQEQEKQKQEQNDPKNPDQQKRDQEKQDPQKKDQTGDPKDQPKPDPKADEKPQEKPQEKKEELPKDASSSDPKTDKKKDAEPQPAKEERLTREEVMRLLDILKGREEEGQKLLEQLRRARRVPVKKDW